MKAPRGEEMTFVYRRIWILLAELFVLKAPEFVHAARLGAASIRYVLRTLVVVTLFAARIIHAIMLIGEYHHQRKSVVLAGYTPRVSSSYAPRTPSSQFARYAFVL